MLPPPRFTTDGNADRVGLCQLAAVRFERSPPVCKTSKMVDYRSRKAPSLWLFQRGRTYKITKMNERRISNDKTGIQQTTQRLSPRR